MSPGQAQLQSEGFLPLPRLLSWAEVQDLRGRVEAERIDAAGSRCLLGRTWCVALADRLRRLPVLAGLLPPEARAVQCSYFEKSCDRNWLVPVHQDLSIPVAERVDGADLGAWSEKEGELFVQAPSPLLQRLLALRVALDDCGPADGPLQLIPASHRRGRIDPAAAAAWRRQGPVQACSMQAGDALAMRPLILHASSKASGRSRRRVLHFLFAPAEPGYGLRWRIGV